MGRHVAPEEREDMWSLRNGKFVEPERGKNCYACGTGKTRKMGRIVGP